MPSRPSSQRHHVRAAAAAHEASSRAMLFGMLGLLSLVSLTGVVLLTGGG